jgi:4'-phosphopantetheinyl transferase
MSHPGRRARSAPDRAGPGRRVPPAGTVEVWRVTLDVPAGRRGRLTASLDAGERDHWERMRIGGDLWAVAHGARREILGHHLERPAASLRFEAGRRGKPMLADAPHLHFNMSSRGPLALLAVASDREVGVDLEQELLEAGVEGVAREFLSPLDQVAISTAPPETRRSVFTAAWTRHEALRKLKGLALEDALPPLFQGELLSVRAIPMPPGFAASVAAEGGEWTLRVREASEVLPEE